MIRTYLRFKVEKGSTNEFVAMFKAERILETSVAQPGCRSAELTLSEDGSTAIVTAVWEDSEAYRKWTQRSDRERLSRRMNQYLSEPVGKEIVGASFRVVHVG